WQAAMAVGLATAQICPLQDTSTVAVASVRPTTPAAGQELVTGTFLTPETSAAAATATTVTIPDTQFQAGTATLVTMTDYHDRSLESLLDSSSADEHDESLADPYDSLSADLDDSSSTRSGDCLPTARRPQAECSNVAGEYAAGPADLPYDNSASDMARLTLEAARTHGTAEESPAFATADRGGSVATAPTDNGAKSVPTLPAGMVEVPVESVRPTWYSGLDGDESGVDHHTSSSDDIGSYTEYEQDIIGLMYYGIPLPGMRVRPNPSANIERDIDDIEGLVRTAAANVAEDPDWGLAAPTTASGTNPGMLQGCDIHSAIESQPPEQHYTCMISASNSIGRGRGHITEKVTGLPGKPVAGTVSAEHSSTDPNNQQDLAGDPPTDHSNFVAPFYGEADAGAAWRGGTTRHDFGTRPDDDLEQQLSMPRLTRYNEVALQRELDQQRREFDLKLEVERLRHERDMTEELARQNMARARMEFEAERLRVARERMETLQLSAVGGAASTDGSAAPPTPTKFGPLDLSTGDIMAAPPRMSKVDRRSAGMPPAGAEEINPHQSQPRKMTGVSSTKQQEPDNCFADSRSGMPDQPQTLPRLKDS